MVTYSISIPAATIRRVKQIGGNERNMRYLLPYLSIRRQERKVPKAFAPPRGMFRRMAA